jgi:hypothetical protein
VVAAVTQQDLAAGFVVPPLLRFVSAEGAYLSNAHGGPRMFLNIEDHLADSTGRVNARFQARPRIPELLRAPLAPACASRTPGVAALTVQLQGDYA